MMWMFFFDMKDGVPLRDFAGIEFITNASGRKIHRGFVIGKPKISASERNVVE